MKKKGFNFVLVSNQDQNNTVSKGKEMGFVTVGKPSINLKGYDFLNVTGGILCKKCKKAICLCPDERKI